MEFTPILAGPILRRVDAHSVTIWIATNQAFDVEAKIYDIDTTNALPTKTRTTSIRAGQKLFIHLVQLNGVFPTDTLLGYNLFFNDGHLTSDLTSLGLISKNASHSITYGDLPYPTFFIPKKTTRNILYASCRKFHGKGEDALAAGDKILQNTRLNQDKRPHSLFLMGDQIYADNVADPLFPVIQTVAEIL